MLDITTKDLYGEDSSEVKSLAVSMQMQLKGDAKQCLEVLLSLTDRYPEYHKWNNIYDLIFTVQTSYTQLVRTNSEAILSALMLMEDVTLKG